MSRFSPRSAGAIVGPVGAIALAVVLLASGAPTSPSGPSASRPAPPSAGVSGASLAPSVSGVTGAAARAATVEADRTSLLAAGGNLTGFDPPNLVSTESVDRTGGHVVPPFQTAPAPMGVAYYGLSNASGTVVGTTLNTTTLRAFFTTSDPLGVETEQFNGGSATAYGAQLNAVLTNVTIDGRTAFGPNVNAPQGCAGFYTGSEANWCPNEFWLQNVINYDPATDQLTFVDNIWNFSDPGAAWATSNGFTLQGRGTADAGFYGVFGPTFDISYPFTVVLYLNATAGRCTTGAPGASTCGKLKGEGPVNEVYFNYTVLNAAGDVVCPAAEPANAVCGEYDDVFWNSLPHAGGSSGMKANSAVLTANGLAYDPVGLPNDWEFDYGIGASDGATTSVTYADAQVGLDYCPAAHTFPNGACSGYVTTPAAYDVGGETGETGQGANSYYVTETNGAPDPGWLSGPGAPVARFVSGPSLFHGLWNYSVAEGGTALEYGKITPANAWVAVAPSTATNQSRFAVAPTFGWYSARSGSGGAGRPTELGDAIYLSPGTYTVEVELSGYAPTSVSVNLEDGADEPTIALVPDAADGVYTPMWAFSASDLANLSVGGDGMAGSPYEILNGSGTVGVPYGVDGSLSWVFADLNDYFYPVWVGAYLNGTRAFTTFSHPAPFTVRFPSGDLSALERFDQPRREQFAYELDRAQNVTVEHAANLSVWASILAVPEASVVCTDCFNDLFAADQFAVADIGLVFSGSDGGLRGEAPYANYPATRNVVWGSTFGSAKLSGYGVDAATYSIEEADSNDRIYDNNFSTNVTVSESSPTEVDAWNVTCQAGYSARGAGEYPGPTPCRPASYAVEMNGVDLTGSILGGSYQGGNAWENYGTFANPYGTLPYVARTTSYTSGGIAQPSHREAGDFAPLVRYRLYEATFTETGLPSSGVADAFLVSLHGSPGWQNASATDATPDGCAGDVCLTFFVPNGTFPYLVSAAANGYAPSPRLGWLPVDGGPPSTTTVVFARAHTLTVTFHETGVPSLSWCASLDGYPLCSDTARVRFTGLSAGAYTYAVVRPAENVTAKIGGRTEPTSGTINVTRNVKVTVTYHYTYSVEFSTSEYLGVTWSVKVGSTTYVGENGLPIVAALWNGTFRFHVAAISGYTVTPRSGSVKVDGAHRAIVIDVT